VAAQQGARQARREGDRKAREARGLERVRHPLRGTAYPPVAQWNADGGLHREGRQDRQERDHWPANPRRREGEGLLQERGDRGIEVGWDKPGFAGAVAWWWVCARRRAGPTL